MTSAPPPDPKPLHNRMPPYTPPERVRWGLRDVAVALAVFVGVQVLGVMFARVTHLATATPFAIGLVTFVLGLVTYGAFVALLVVASRRKGLGTLANDFGLRFKPIDILLGIGAALLAKLALVFFGVLAVSLTGKSPDRGNLVLSSDSLWLVLNAVVIASIVAPVVEELIFRGLMLRAIRNAILRSPAAQQPRPRPVRERAVVVSVLVSSAAFAALHLAQADGLAMVIVLGGSTFAVGLIHAALAIRTGRLGAAIISHALFNGSAVALALVYARG